jgi:hypothetical protein
MCMGVTCLYKTYQTEKPIQSKLKIKWFSLVQIKNWNEPNKIELVWFDSWFSILETDEPANRTNREHKIVWMENDSLKNW